MNRRNVVMSFFGSFVTWLSTRCTHKSGAVRTEPAGLGSEYPASSLAHIAYHDLRPERIVVNCGSLEIDVPGPTFRATKLLVNGKPMPARRLVLILDVEGVNRCYLDFFPNLCLDDKGNVDHAKTREKLNEEPTTSVSGQL